MCDGSVLPVSPSLLLFSILGSTFGGDGNQTFGLPDLRGTVALGAVEGGGGMPAHGKMAGNERVPTEAMALSPPAVATATVNSVAGVSGSNVQPVLGLNYIICRFGKFPARSASEPVEGTIGEIRLFGGDFAPTGWARCDGSVLSIADPRTNYRPLFDVLGNTYGGDGQATFALPDLRGRAAVGVGQGTGLSPYRLGQAAGSGRIPTQSVAVSDPNGLGPGVRSVLPRDDVNFQPSLALTYIICVNGIFPSRG